MTKQELLDEIKLAANQGTVSKDEVVNAYIEGSSPGSHVSLLKNLSLATVLYYLGAAIVFIGICIFVSQNWTNMSFATKLLVTLGSAIVAYIAGYAFVQRQDFEGVGQAFFLISALIAPLGMFVLFDHLGLDTNASSTQAIISGILFIIYFASLWFLRRIVFQIFLFTFGTWLFFTVANLLIYGNSTYTVYDQTSFYEYRFLVTGLVYLLFGYWFSKRPDGHLSGALYGFGSLFFLGAALALGGWSIADGNVLWQILFPGLVFALIIFSVNLKSKALLTFGAIFLMAYILKITAIYFSDTLGWPLALVIAGLMLIAIGYYTFYISRRYISSQAQPPVGS